MADWPYWLKISVFLAESKYMFLNDDFVNTKHPSDVSRPIIKTDTSSNAAAKVQLFPDIASVFPSFFVTL